MAHFLYFERNLHEKVIQQEKWISDEEVTVLKHVDPADTCMYRINFKLVRCATHYIMDMRSFTGSLVDLEFNNTYRAVYNFTDHYFIPQGSLIYLL